jgi:hypothetical protein
MRAYSKKINLIQIANNKLSEFNKLANSNGYNQIYLIEDSDISSVDVTRMINDIDLLVEEINSDEREILESYLDARNTLDKLRIHIRATNKKRKEYAE